ncbi:hypothetical protein [Haloarchaeobius sp. HME9146]|uniref:DUF7576 family protein n=1 Tax=Haloarchaeobius sp. HME9146 TaxID=2978732 RepID=UPI0021BE32BA|nr:hypothetical protein [Haloarchaeobius sp. HME9146]MCT9097582.1 hypothetical protein [Haloarchaeobius sp. HME9146]
MDPTETAPAETQQPAADSCAICGTPVTTSEWHPAATKTTATGKLVIVSFCGQPCRDDWADEQ